MTTTNKIRIGDRVEGAGIVLSAHGAAQVAFAGEVVAVDHGAIAAWLGQPVRTPSLLIAVDDGSFLVVPRRGASVSG